MIDLLLYGVFPYVAIVLAVTVSLLRFSVDRFSYSSLSSQFLEGRQLFWGSVPWHIGILIVLAGHVVGIVLPSSVKAFNGVPLRLYILEGTGLALGVMALVGLIILALRRITSPRVRAVTTTIDFVVLALLLVQVLTGVGTAIFHRWGSFWFVNTATPYIWSLVTLSPRWDYVASMPILVKLHVLSFFVLVAIFPFSRLIHIVSLPLSYLWRPYQLVRWSLPMRRPVD
ncbi:MAG: respiratory nitrate reductase subunit gamma [Dehalococcoidia bacterium]|nr:respiratory nitrate reductase subunit gamma [Dehalococcoidia bacterium]